MEFMYGARSMINCIFFLNNCNIQIKNELTKWTFILHDSFAVTNNVVWVSAVKGIKFTLIKFQDIHQILWG